MRADIKIWIEGPPEIEISRTPKSGFLVHVFDTSGDQKIERVMSVHSFREYVRRGQEAIAKLVADTME